MNGEWEIKCLAEVSNDVSYGYTASATHDAVGPRFLRITDIQGGVVNWSKVPFCSITETDELKYQLQKGDIVVARTGNSTGENYMMSRNLNAVFASYLIRFRIDSDVADPGYVWYNMRSDRWRRFLSGCKTGSAQAGANARVLGAFEIPLPPLPEQRRIAKILGDLDDKIELNRKMNETLEQMARALFKSWFVDFDPVRAKMEGRTPTGMDAATAALFPDRLVDSELGPIPEGWEVGSIYDVAEVVYGAPFASKDFTSDPVGRPLIRIRDLSTENPRVYTSEVHPKGYLVNPGDVVVGMDGEFRAHLWGGPVSWLNQRLCVFAPKETFGTAFIMNSIANPLAEVEATETATTVIHLGKNDIDRFRIVVPASNISSRYALLCQPLFDQIVFNKLQSRTLLTLRDTLLPKLVGGEVRVGVPETHL